MKSPKSCHQGLISFHVQGMHVNFLFQLNIFAIQSSQMLIIAVYLQSLSPAVQDKNTFFFLDFFFLSGDVLVVLSIDAMEGVLTAGGSDLELVPDPTWCYVVKVYHALRKTLHESIAVSSGYSFACFVDRSYSGFRTHLSCLGVSVINLQQERLSSFIQ